MRLVIKKQRCLALEIVARPSRNKFSHGLTRNYKKCHGEYGCVKINKNMEIRVIKIQYIKNLPPEDGISLLF